MNVILAENISGWLFAGTLLTAGIVSSLLALVALIPASRGNRPAAILLGAPAVLLAAAGITAWVIADTIRSPQPVSSGGAFRTRLFLGSYLQACHFSPEPLHFRLYGRRAARDHDC